MGDLSKLSWRVIDTIQKLIDSRGMTDAEVIVKSGIPRNTFYRKMRGDTPFNTDDLGHIAEALNVDPYVLLVGASRQDYGLVANESIDEQPIETDADFDNA